MRYRGADPADYNPARARCLSDLPASIKENEMKACVTAIAAILLFGLCSTSAWSSEADELREKAKAIQSEAEQLAKQGHQEEAGKLQREAKELLQAAQKHDAKESKPRARKGEIAAHKGEIQELEQRLKGLAEKEQALKEEAGNKEGLADLQKHRTAIEQELKTLREHLKHEPSADRPKAPGDAKTKHGPPAELEDAARRIKHLRVASDNLRAAGMHDLGEQLAKQAEALERDVHQAHEHPEKPGPGHKSSNSPEHEAAPLEELRRDVQQLRAELKELREELKKRP